MTKKTQIQLAPSKLPVPATEADDSAEAFYQRQLATTTSPKKRHNLERVWRALETLRKEKRRRFTAKAVADVIAESDDPSPTHQAILNKTGQHFRDLIRAYALQYGDHDGNTDRRDDDIRDALKDPVLQMHYAYKLNLIKSLTHSENLLKQQLERLASTPQAVPTRKDEFAVVCTTVDAYAVKEFLASVESDPRWTFDANGALIEAAGGGKKPRSLAPAGFEDALRKLADRSV